MNPNEQSMLFVPDPKEPLFDQMALDRWSDEGGACPLDDADGALPDMGE